MQLASIKAQAFAVFNKADDVSVVLLSDLLPLGIGSRADAKPLVIEWAEAKYKCKAYKGQRGITFKQGSTARMAMNRVLDRIFGGETKPSKPTANKVDPVKKLHNGFQKLNANERRRFLLSLNHVLVQA